jgi:hypothetical protein
MKEQRPFNGAGYRLSPATVVSNGSEPPAVKSDEGVAVNEMTTRRKTPERGQEEMLGVILKMQRDLYEHGKTRAIESGALMANDEHLRALESHAEAIAREAHREAYNPSLHQHDQLLDSEYQKNLRDRDEAEHAVKYAQAAMRDREEEAAQAHPGEPPKPLGWALPTAAVIAMMITTAPTLHDFVFVMADEFFSWLLSLLSGLFLGLLVTLMILGDSEHSGERTATNWIGLCAGIFVSLALGALRVKGATSSGDYIFAAAMTALELGIVIGLEGIATSRRKAHRVWAARKAVADPANARLDVARTHVERSKDHLEAINRAIKAHINYVEERGVRFQRIEEISATALEAVRDGYHSGIAENRGRILGIGGK